MVVSWMTQPKPTVSLYTNSWR